MSINQDQKRVIFSHLHLSDGALWTAKTAVGGEKGGKKNGEMAYRPSPYRTKRSHFFDR